MENKEVFINEILVFVNVEWLIMVGYLNIMLQCIFSHFTVCFPVIVVTSNNNHTHISNTSKIYSKLDLWRNMISRGSLVIGC